MAVANLADLAVLWARLRHGPAIGTPDAAGKKAPVATAAGSNRRGGVASHSKSNISRSITTSSSPHSGLQVCRVNGFLPGVAVRLQGTQGIQGRAADWLQLSGLLGVAWVAMPTAAAPAAPFLAACTDTTSDTTNAAAKGAPAAQGDIEQPQHRHAQPTNRDHGHRGRKALAADIPPEKSRVASDAAEIKEHRSEGRGPLHRHKRLSDVEHLTSVSHNVEHQKPM
mmetsp:Transcript_27091/g.69471  ORF Transcript_27091/g.69471 Transcript_27091/m.69471 type:complete len:225 (-) Transcript_27091:82-756(-)